MVQISGPPAVNFYGMLSGLGDIIADNRKQAAVKTALDAATQPGVSYGDAIRGLVAAGAMPQAQLYATLQAHQDALARQSQEDARQAARDKVADQHFNMSYALQKQNADRLNESPLDKANERAEALKAQGIDPASPEGQNYVLTGTYAGATKPIPMESLSGTKFLVPHPGGSYTVLDPNSLPQQGGPAPVGQPSLAPSGPVASAAPGSFADRFAAAAPQSVAPSAAPAAPPDLSAVDPQTGRRENYLKTLSPDAQQYIKKIADYQIDPRTSSVKGGMREKILSAVAQYDPSYDQNTFASRNKAIKDFSTGQQGNAIRSFDVATDHLDTLQKYAEALKSGDYPLINSIRNAWMAQTGSSLPTNVQAVAPIVGAEVSKAIIGSNNALADREELRKPLNTANSPDQLAGAIQGYKALMAGQLRGLKKQYEDTTGKKDFNNRLRDNTRSVLMGGELPGNIPQPAIDFLRQNPQHAADFDAKYGQGASKAVLGN